MTQKTIALLDDNDIVINRIIVDDNTPKNFLASLIADKELFAAVKSTEQIDQLATSPGNGWKRTAPGKYTPPDPIIVEPPVDVVTQVLEDDRLSDFSSGQIAVLTDVLNEHLNT